MFKRLIVILALVPSIAIAQPAPKPRPALTGDIVKDTGNLFNRNTPTSNTAPNSNDACDFNLLALLKADKLLTQIHNCIQTKLFDDVSAALDSATAFKDQPGMACLKPGLEIIKAAKGTPAVDAIPATGASPEVPAVPAIDPGPILLFQKFREFELSGGPAACKTWVNSTIQGANPLTN